MINTKKFVLLVGLVFSCDTNWFLITDPGSKIVSSITMAFIERLHAHCRDSMDYHSLNLAHACKTTFYLLFMPGISCMRDLVLQLSLQRGFYGDGKVPSYYKYIVCCLQNWPRKNDDSLSREIFLIQFSSRSFAWQPLIALASISERKGGLWHLFLAIPQWANIFCTLL